MLCLLAADEADGEDIALQIHFTLIRAFCCANDIHILRASGLERLAAVLGEGPPGGGGAEPRDLHCLLVTVSRAAGALAGGGAPGGRAEAGLELT